jgi:hypothetical protein
MPSFDIRKNYHFKFNRGAAADSLQSKKDWLNIAKK